MLSIAWDMVTAMGWKILAPTAANELPIKLPQNLPDELLELAYPELWYD